MGEFDLIDTGPDAADGAVPLEAVRVDDIQAMEHPVLASVARLLHEQESHSQGSQF